MALRAAERILHDVFGRFAGDRTTLLAAQRPLAFVEESRALRSIAAAAVARRPVRTRRCASFGAKGHHASRHWRSAFDIVPPGGGTRRRHPEGNRSRKYRDKPAQEACTREPPPHESIASDPRPLFSYPRTCCPCWPFPGSPGGQPAQPRRRDELLSSRRSAPGRGPDRSDSLAGSKATAADSRRAEPSICRTSSTGAWPACTERDSGESFRPRHYRATASRSWHASGLSVSWTASAQPAVR